jgi:hypothetical protein
LDDEDKIVSTNDNNFSALLKMEYAISKTTFSYMHCYPFETPLSRAMHKSSPINEEPILWEHV